MAIGEAGFESIEFVLCDLDGVIWLAHEPIPGSPEAVARLRAAGVRVLFVTNNSMSVIADQEQALADIGIPAVDDVITSAQAAASLVRAGERVLVCGGPGVVEAVEQGVGTVVDDPDDADAVIVGLHRDFDYHRLAAANRAIRRGARFIATNDDPSYPTPDGETPGAGSIVAAVATASGAQPEVAGKPHQAMADLAAQRCGDRFGPDTVLMVGDRWTTDGLFADVIDCPFAMVRTGVTEPKAEAGGVAHIDEVDLATVVDVALGT